MIQRPVVGRRAAFGIALSVWIILIAFGTLRAQAEGPQWGMVIGLNADGHPAAAAMDGIGTAWSGGVRLHNEILTVDGRDAGLFVGSGLPTDVREITYVDAAGVATSLRAADLSSSLLGLLIVGGLGFALLGGLVFRWSADPTLGRLFLIFSTAFATVLVAAPAGLLGYAWAGYLTPAAALVAAPALFGLFLCFPRTVRHGHRLAYTSVLLAIPLVLGELGASAFGTTLWPDVGPVIDTVSWLWMMLNLLGALGLLAVRASRRSDRHALAPLLMGAVVGVGPLIILVAVPHVLGLQPWIPVEVATIAAGAIPLSFAYSILRFQVFGLDALMRKVLLRAGGAFTTVVVFLGGSAVLQAGGLSPIEAVVLAAIATAVIAPKLASWAETRLDAWLYRPLYSLRSIGEPLRADRLETLGNAMAVRLRGLLRVRWAACVVHDDTTIVNPVSGRLLGADGEVPGWLEARAPIEHPTPPGLSVAPIVRFDNRVVLLLAGPRLDGAPLDGIEFEAMKLLATSRAPTFEAGLLRERGEDEARFRQGLTDMARDLAAAGTVSDVLRCLRTHAARLLSADVASLWRWGPHGAMALLEDETATPRPTVALRELLDTRQAHRPDARWTALTADKTSLAFAVDDDGEEQTVCLVHRASDAPRFGVRDEGRALELIEHTSGALRRAAERELLEEQLRHRAFYDSLTGLPNRALFLDRLEHALARGETSGQELAVMFIDLDRFKVVNDSLGHAAGDQLLVQFGSRLRACMRQSDTIARPGGDEFTVLLEGPSAVADAVQASERLLATLRAPFLFDGQEAFVSASIGISGGARGGEATRDLLREADIALYRGKAAGGGRYTLFEARMNELPAEHLQLESDLHRAVERNELRVYYQPIFALHDGHITGFEALVRWDRAGKGLVQPDHFIPLAEDTGLIVPIGKWVLDEACRQMHVWQLEDPRVQPLSISVNVSARQLQDAHLLQDVEHALATSGLDPTVLVLEITESVVMHDPDATLLKLHALKALGLKLAVDDFGTGYSSLAYLKRFPIDVLKIDRAFVMGLGQGEYDSAFVQTVVSLARALGLKTTAEGIEEQSQWARLEALGCNHGQGYFVSRPLPAAAVQPFLVQHAARRNVQAAA